MRVLEFTFCMLALAGIGCAATPPLERACKIRTEEDWYSARTSAKSYLSQDDFASFVWALDWIEMKVRQEYSEPHTADTLCAVLLDGRTARQIIVLGTLLQSKQSVAAELENRALESESPDPEKKKLYRLRADEARGEQALAREIMLKYARPEAPKGADPAVSANAREWSVIRMNRLRSTSPVIQKGSLSARPRVAHL